MSNHHASDCNSPSIAREGLERLPASDLNLLRAVLWFALQRLANGDQENGTLVFCVRGKEVNYIVVEEGQPGSAQVLSIRSQVDPAADDACLQLDGPIAAVPVSLQNAFQIGEKEDIHAGVRREILVQAKMMGLGTEFALIQKFQCVLVAAEEVCCRPEPLHCMHDQVKIIKLSARRLEEVSRKTSRRIVENGRKLWQCNGSCLIESSGRAAAQDYLLGRVLRLVCFRQTWEANGLSCQNGGWEDWWLASPFSYFLCRFKRRCVVHLKHGGIFDLVLRKRDCLQAKRRNLSRN